MVLANTGGRFELICTDVRTAEGNINANSTVLNVNCGFSFTSLDRITFGFYPTLSTAAALSVSNRVLVVSVSLLYPSMVKNIHENAFKSVLLM